MTPTGGRKDKAPEVEERAEAPKRRDPFTVVAEALNEIRDHFAYTQKIIRVHLQEAEEIGLELEIV